MVLPPSGVEDMTQLSTWSYSRLVDFEQCPLRAKLKYIDKIPEPERPLPPGKTEHANDRGTRVHTAAELFVQKPIELAPELATFKEELLRLRELYKQGRVSLEGEWGMDRDWTPAPWKSAWHRSKLDALVLCSPEEAVVIDYKSGRRIYNEVKHGEQLQLYQLNTFLRHPTLEVVHAELWYLDAKELTSVTYTRDQGLRFLRSWDQRGKKITSNTDWKPNPNKFSCQYCPYGKWGTGHCQVGVRE